MAEIKTKPNTANVEDFINKVKDEQKRKDGFVILEMMKKASDEEPKMWGTSLIGFGNARFKSPTKFQCPILDNLSAISYQVFPLHFIIII